jgi:hypothetical protein
MTAEQTRTEPRKAQMRVEPTPTEIGSAQMRVEQIQMEPS